MNQAGLLDGGGGSTRGGRHPRRRRLPETSERRGGGRVGGGGRGVARGHGEGGGEGAGVGRGVGHQKRWRRAAEGVPVAAVAAGAIGGDEKARGEGLKEKGRKSGGDVRKSALASPDCTKEGRTVERTQRKTTKTVGGPVQK